MGIPLHHILPKPAAPSGIARMTSPAPFPSRKIHPHASIQLLTFPLGDHPTPQLHRYLPNPTLWVQRTGDASRTIPLRPALIVFPGTVRLCPTPACRSGWKTLQNRICSHQTRAPNRVHLIRRGMISRPVRVKRSLPPFLRQALLSSPPLIFLWITAWRTRTVPSIIKRDLLFIWEQTREITPHLVKVIMGMEFHQFLLKHRQHSTPERYRYQVTFISNT